MHAPHDCSADLHGQDTDLWIIGVLFPHLTTRSFIDVGAEKGGFAKALFRMGFERGVLCEPLPAHVQELGRRFAAPHAAILPYAIDREDRTASLHVACDAAGNDLDYFHSLNRVPDHDYFRHGRHLDVRCRSLESLLASGEVDADIGLLKIDTEGNDLRVLQGLGRLRPELIMCEFVPPAVYPHWPLSFAENLLAEAGRLGYRHVVAIQRTHGVAGEWVRIDPAGFTANDWGNLVLVREDVFAAAALDLQTYTRGHADRFHGQQPIPVRHDPRYGVACADWLQHQVEAFSRTANRSVAIDVGAHEGAFFQPLLQANRVSRLVLFEPQPANAARLRQRFVDPRVTVEEVAVAAATGSAEFLFGDDTATGSLLQPTGPTPAATQACLVPTTSLDDYATAHGLIDTVNVLKIDTQGTDAAVLHGAERLLFESQPLLFVELIFAPLYERQGDPAAIMAWLAERDYRLAGFFDEHFSREGWLAWTDACFVPVARLPGYRPPFMLRGACD
jgi:FkbM family methyltransferase